MIATERLLLSRLSHDDADFICELVNQPSFKRFIGDKGVRTLEDARKYLRDGPIGSYEKHGFGLFLVSLADGALPVGICGLVKRENLADPDLGFAFLAEHWSQGYAYESSVAVLEHGRNVLGLKRIIAIVDRDNGRSVQLLVRLGFTFEQMVRMPGETDDICLYALDT